MIIKKRLVKVVVDFKRVIPNTGNPLCRRSDDGSSCGSNLSDRLISLCLGLSSRCIPRRRVLQRSDRLGLVDLGRVLIDLGGGGNLGLGPGLEQVTDTCGETTANLGGFGSHLGLLLFLLLQLASTGHNG